MTTLTDVQKALHNSQVLDQHWIIGGYDALSEQLEEELRKENEIIKLFSLVDQVEPDIRMYAKVFQRHSVYCVPLSDVSPIVDINQVLHIQEKDLYPNWKERILSNLGNSVRVRKVTDDKKTAWNQIEYIDYQGDIRIIYQKF